MWVISRISTLPWPNFLTLSLIHLLTRRLPSPPIRPRLLSFPFPLHLCFLLPTSLPPPPPPPPPPASPSTRSLFLCSMYCRILMWPVRELVKLSQLCACRSQRPTPPTAGSPLPLELSSSLYVDKWTEEGFSSSILCPSQCIHCFLWPFLDQTACYSKGFRSRSDWICTKGFGCKDNNILVQDTPDLEIRCVCEESGNTVYLL